MGTMRRKDKSKCTAADVRVGQRIRLRRSILRLSPKALAEKLGISDQQLRKNEKGVNRVGAGRLYEIAVILRVPISYFYEGLSPVVRGATAAAPMAAGAMKSIELLDSQGMKFARALARIRNPKKRLQIAKLIEALASDDRS